MPVSGGFVSVSSRKSSPPPSCGNRNVGATRYRYPLQPTSSLAQSLHVYAGACWLLASLLVSLEVAAATAGLPSAPHHTRAELASAQLSSYQSHGTFSYVASSSSRRALHQAASANNRDLPRCVLQGGGRGQGVMSGGLVLQVCFKYMCVSSFFHQQQLVRLPQLHIMCVCGVDMQGGDWPCEDHCQQHLQLEHTAAVKRLWCCCHC